MDIITINNGEYIKEVGSRGFGMGFADPVSSTTLIRKKQFEEFSLPYLKRNIADVKNTVVLLQGYTFVVIQKICGIC